MRLQKIAGGVAHHVAAQAGCEDGLLHGGLVGAHECVDENVGGHKAFAVGRIADHVGHAHQRVVRRGGHLDALVIADERILAHEWVGPAYRCGAIG
ncbi:Uncharacterised protein [Collinsella intestinalis]|nr:Uncharacterised protein [Collinsella intestinalis]